MEESLETLQSRGGPSVSGIAKQLSPERGPGNLAWAGRLLARLPVLPTESKQKPKDGVVMHFSLPICLF